LIRRAEDLGIANRVHFRGSVSPEELARELARAAVLVLPSRQETASVSVMEAMAAGLPIVATNVGGTRHFVENGVSGRLVPVGDTARLAEALAGYLGDPECASEHGRVGRRIAEERFRIDRAIDRTIEVYRQVIASP
jgi:glycosyltransferase involved in cell wall biosynthesis